MATIAARDVLSGDKLALRKKGDEDFEIHTVLTAYPTLFGTTLIEFTSGLTLDVRHRTEIPHVGAL